MDVRTLCLGVLSGGAASGYEIKKKLETTYSHFFQASFGSIYPALNRLTGDGLVSCTEQAQEKRPDKKVYNITAEGRMALIDQLSVPPGPDRVRCEFLVIMLFAELLTPRQLDRVIDEYLARHRQRIAEIESSCAQPQSGGKLFVKGYGLAVYEAAVDYVEENRHLVVGESLLGAAQSAD